MALDIVAWHDRTSSDHLTQYNNARAAGYSTGSLCVYGDPGSPLYAAAMVKRATQTPEQHFPQLNGGTLQTTFNTMAATGWGPEIMTGTGPTANPLYAAVFIQTSPIPLTRNALTASDFNSLNQSQMNSGFILRWADVYGDPGNLRYIGIWVANTDNRAWNCDGIDDHNPNMQSRFNALVGGFGRPVVVATIPDGGNLMMYDDSQMPFWQEWNGMTSADYQAKFNTLYSQGLRPIRVSAKGTGSNARFGVLFSQQEDAGARTWRINGPAGSSAVAAIDSAMEAVMTANMIRGASLAVVSGTRLVYTRGYTWAEPGVSGYPADDFLPAGKRLQDVYGLRDLPVDGRGSETAWNQHRSDARHAIAGRIAQYRQWDASRKLEQDYDPASAGDDQRHYLRDPCNRWQRILDAAGECSADGTVALSAAVSKHTWRHHQGHLQQCRLHAAGPGDGADGGTPDYVSGLATLLNSLHISRVRSAVSIASAQHADEARYHSRPLATEPSVMATGQPFCAEGYGDWNLENLAEEEVCRLRPPIPHACSQP